MNRPLEIFIIYFSLSRSDYSLSNFYSQERKNPLVIVKLFYDQIIEWLYLDLILRATHSKRQDKIRPGRSAQKVTRFARHFMISEIGEQNFFSLPEFLGFH
jgi:hypothetical protein